MADEPHPPERRAGTRRQFLRTAGVLAAGATVGSVACDDPARDGARDGASDARASGRSSGPTRWDRSALDALGDTVLPSTLGETGRRAAVGAFIAWIDAYEPVAEEMHGYGYSDVRWLPPDPAPAWRAQLDGLDLLARRSRGKAFTELDAEARRAVVDAAIARVPSGRLPAPLAAPHVAIALLSHWATTPDAWDLALGARVGAGTCRSLDGVAERPLPIVGAAG